MAITAFDANTQTASIGTEHFLANVNLTGIYTFHVDLSNMAAGDYLELRVYQMILTGGTARVAYLMTYQGAQPADSLIAVSVPIPNDLTDTNSLRFSLKQTLGTGRQFAWKVLKNVISTSDVISADVTKISGDTTAADNAESFFDGTGYAGTGNVIPTVTAVTGLTASDVGAIKAKTDNLPSDPADASDIATSFSTVNTKLDAIDDYVDTEVAAIKAKTDNLPSDPADASDIAALIATAQAAINAIKAKTDSLTFTVAGKADANITHVISNPVQEDGADDTNWGGTP